MSHNNPIPSTLISDSSAVGRSLLTSANAAAARAAIGVAGTTLGHLWERPAPDSVALGSSFISSDDLTEQVSSGVVVSPATITSGWMQKIPSGIGAGRAGLIGGSNARAFADGINLSAYTIDTTTVACLFSWNGVQPISYGFSEIVTFGDRNNADRGIHIVLVTNGAATDLGIYSGGLLTVLVPGIAAGLHSLAVAPVTVGVGLVANWRFSFDGSAVADVPMTNPIYTPPTSSDCISFGARGDGVVYLNGQAIELAVWGVTTLSPANILALATLPATPTYEIPETASTGAAAIMVQPRRFDPRTSTTAMPGRGLSVPLTVSTTKVTL